MLPAGLDFSSFEFRSELSERKRMRKYMENKIQNLIWLLIPVLKNCGDFACDQIN